MKIFQSSLFARKIKKINKNDKTIFDLEIEKIANNPQIGQQKKGDLNKVSVHKFKINTKQILLAYQFNQTEINLIMFGEHENFYRDLKKYK